MKQVAGNLDRTEKRGVSIVHIAKKGVAELFEGDTKLMRAARKRL